MFISFSYRLNLQSYIIELAYSRKYLNLSSSSKLKKFMIHYYKMI